MDTDAKKLTLSELRQLADDEAAANTKAQSEAAAIQRRQSRGDMQIEKLFATAPRPDHPRFQSAREMWMWHFVRAIIAAGYRDNLLRMVPPDGAPRPWQMTVKLLQDATADASRKNVARLVQECGEGIDWYKPLLYEHDWLRSWIFDGRPHFDPDSLIVDEVSIVETDYLPAESPTQCAKRMRHGLDWVKKRIEEDQLRRITITSKLWRLHREDVKTLGGDIA